MKPAEARTVQQELDDDAVLKALEIGSKRAVRIHKLLGNPVATLRDGKVVLIPPQEIQIDDSPGVIEFPQH